MNLRDTTMELTNLLLFSIVVELLIIIILIVSTL